MPIHKVNTHNQPQIAWGSTIRNHTAGRIDAITKIAISAIFTVVATLKFLGRGTAFLAKKICRLETDSTRINLKGDLLTIAKNATLIVTSILEVIFAPTSKTTCSIELLKDNLIYTFKGADVQYAKKSYDKNYDKNLTKELGKEEINILKNKTLHSCREDLNQWKMSDMLLNNLKSFKFLETAKPVSSPEETSSIPSRFGLNSFALIKARRDRINSIDEKLKDLLEKINNDPKNKQKTDLWIETVQRPIQRLLEAHRLDDSLPYSDDIQQTHLKALNTISKALNTFHENFLTKTKDGIMPSSPENG